MDLTSNEKSLIIDSLKAYLDDDNEEYNNEIISLINKLSES